MKLINSSFEILDHQCGLEGIYKEIELAGRTCYKSEDKITEDSAKGFVDRMIKSDHRAMLEHGTVYLDFTDDVFEAINKYTRNHYSRVYKNTLEDDWDMPHAYITTNYRVLIENGWLDDLEYLCEPTEFHEKRISVRFVCDRGVSHEFVRHRVFSFAQESTRYCNYSKNRFNNELTFILPLWVNEIQLGEQNSQELLIQIGNLDNPTYSKEDLNDLYFLFSVATAEIQYFNLINGGWKPQQARAVLPNALKTELVMTGFVSDWQHFFDLRARGITGAPHPQAKELAEPLMKEFIARKYINN